MGICLVIAAVALTITSPKCQDACLPDSTLCLDTSLVVKDTIYDTTVVLDTVEVPREY